MTSKAKETATGVGAFIQKYGDEALSVAEALNSILGGLALPIAAQATVQATIDRLQEAHENISADDGNIVVKISADDIEAAVSKYLDGALPGILSAVVKAEIEAASK